MSFTMLIQLSKIEINEYKNSTVLGSTFEYLNSFGKKYSAICAFSLQRQKCKKVILIIRMANPELSLAEFLEENNLVGKLFPV